MPAVSETIVREYFEMLGFMVQQPHKYTVMARTKRAAEEVDFVAVRPQPSAPPGPPPAERMLASGEDLTRLGRVMVSVRAWHTDRFSEATLKLSPEILRFAEEGGVREAQRLLGPGPLHKILCLPALPSSPVLAGQALALLREKGVDHVLLFPTMLRELARYVEVSKNYEKSDLLQTLRILKNYDLLKGEQLELFRRKAPRRRRDPGAAAS